MPLEWFYELNRWGDVLWLGLGFLGQGIFGARMLVQWFVSEKEKKSVVPVQFWYMSVVGAVITLVYAIGRKDPVFVYAQAGGLIVYLRNLHLITKNKRLAKEEALATAGLDLGILDPATDPEAEAVRPQH